MTAPRVVLDTNVAVSTLVFAEGRLAWLHHEWTSGRVRPLISRPVAAELIRVLEYPKFRLSSAEREKLLGAYLPACEVILVPRTAAASIPECRDPNDRMFLELALAGRADCLVTGDADLLALAGRFAVPILDAERLRLMLTPGAGSSASERVPDKYVATRDGKAKGTRRKAKTQSRATR